MSKQATISNLFQRALDSGVAVKATIDDVVIETQPQPPQTRQCTHRKGKSKQCNRRVPLDSKWKLCDTCRGINKKSRQKCVAAFRADPVAQAAAADQVVVPEGHVRCNKNANAPGWCKRTVLAKSKLKLCAECRASANKEHKKRRADPKVRAQEAEYHREYAQTPAGKATQKRNRKKPGTKLRNCLSVALKRAGVQSRTLKELGTFSSNEDVRRHFETTFNREWMTWDNHGRLRHTDGYKTVWNIGHRIPCAVYTLDNLSEARKCFDKRNLYAQDARENLELHDSLVLTDAELLALKPVWPSEALLKGLDWFKAAFAKANETSHAVLVAKLEAERARAETHGAPTSDEDDEEDDEDEPDEDELFDDEEEEDEGEEEEGEECESEDD